jgi:flagellar basal-body rod protein FlgF
MENAQLIALSRQLALQKQMDVVANNVANINTTGFKAEMLLHEEFVMPVALDQDFPLPDQELSFTQDWATIHDLAPGSIVQTGNPFDIALSGDGFLVVETPEGERWTRAGALQLDAEGTLVDFDGNPVMGDGGAITFDAGDTDVAIDATGAVSTAAGAKGRLRIVEFADPQTLTRVGSNLFSGGEPEAAVATRVVQGAIEKSNVNGITEIAEMIRVQRSYESVTAIMQRQDDIRREAINTLGSLSA